ncbi:AAA family ATPase [Deinococcus sp.]|uniref:AAA family ATPase n=1 Tax=Deinococcus sp. TaxID=47478 RepID=UPI003B5C19C9
MLVVHLFGHAYVTTAQTTVPISAKATALIVYLYMEKLPQHREKLADLLWDTPEARKNLRVELARIRSAGLNIFPASQQLLHLENVKSDFDLWREQAGTSMNQTQLTAWLAMLRGLPFTGLEDLGSSNFQSWVDQQRWLMLQQIEQHLGRVYWRYEREHHHWATRLIAERADVLGLESPGLEAPEADTRQVGAALDVRAPSGLSSGLSAVSMPAPSDSAPPKAGGPGRIGSVYFERPHEEHELRQAFSRAETQTQFVVLHGPAGSGKSHLAGRVARQLDWQKIQLSSVRSGRLVIANLAQALLKLCGPESAGALSEVLLRPSNLEEDMVKVAYALASLPRPVLLIFEQPQDAPAELLPLIEFLFGAGGEAGRLYLLLSRESAEEVPLARALLRVIEKSRYLNLAMPPLTSQSVQRTLEAQFPFEPSQRLRSYAAHLTQRSEGNPLHLLGLLEQAPNLEGLGRPQLPQALRDTFGLELDRWSPRLRGAVERLSVIHGRFDVALARAVLDEPGDDVEALLYEALERRVLVEAEPETALDWPACLYERAPVSAEAEYVFRSEGLRITLAAQLPQVLRQTIRCRLMEALAESSPGMAAYYAKRANLPDAAARLHALYLKGLPADSPLRSVSEDMVGGANSSGVSPRSPGQTAAQIDVVTETTAPQGPDRLLMRQGYLMSHNSGGLTILSSNRYAHPSTLTLRFELPGQGPLPTSVRLLWRLDVYGGGEELGPALAPFALRVGAPQAPAHVLLPGGSGEYQEQGRPHRPLPGVGLGGWMEHDLTLDWGQTPTRTLELSVRAVNLALTLKAVIVGNQNMLAIG